MVSKRISDEQARQALARAVELSRENDELLQEPDSGTSGEAAVERPADEPRFG